MFAKEEVVSLSEGDFRLLRDLIRDHCGIFFDDGSRFLLERRLSRRLKLYHLSDFRDYYRLLLYDRRKDEELTAAIDILTVNETFFFREQNQLKAFSEEILPELRETNKEKRRIRIWSAGCSSGEEPYTIAMLILEYGGLRGWDVEILGSDINQRVLTAARRGVYRKNSFRSAETHLIGKYFREEGGAFTISEEVKRLVSFSCLNLLDPFKVRFMGQMDAIFCRNVMIYFDHVTRKKVVDNFYANLVEGGYLLLGHAESLMNLSTSFALRHLKNDMVYQKPVDKAVYSKC
ncbi:MAG: protein-glutamate O-methyltransferase CheR [Nitrospirae bacterium]|nr:protein-glutamate O-methyltransferase CheR [Nitrospirota bacterium]